jgi:hypothetical protein
MECVLYDLEINMEKARGSYSLLLLFYLTTMAAILTAAGRLAFDNELLTLRSFALGTIVVGFCGSFIGSVIGYLCGCSFLGAVIGMMVGISVSPIAAWIALVEPKHFLSASGIVFIGCWLVVAIAVAANRVQTLGRRRATA